MKMKKLLLAFASIALVASCDENAGNVEVPVVEQESVSFTASMKNLSRATETAFESGDKIVVYAVKDEGYGTSLQQSGNYASHVEYTYNGSRFVNDKSGIVYSETTPVRYYAIYPSLGVSSAPQFVFNVETNQSSDDNYTLSDLCTSVSEISSNKVVDLVFSHRLSHVIVNLEGAALGSGNLTVKLNDVYVQCDVDINANTYAFKGSKKSIQMADNGTNSFKAIIVPQTIEAGSTFLTVTLDGKDYVLKAKTDLCFTSGKQMVFDLAITKDEIVSYTGSIVPWEEETIVEQIIPEEIRVKMEPYITIYDGANPPNVEGCYYVDPLEDVYLEDYPDGSMENTNWASQWIKLANQDMYLNTIDMEELSATGTSYSAGMGSFIVGEGDNFSILFDAEGETDGIYTRTVTLLSGTKGDNGIYDLKYAFIMAEKGDDPEGHLMAEGVFRVFEDEDYFSEETAWPLEETRVGEWIPEGQGLLNITSRVSK